MPIIASHRNTASEVAVHWEPQQEVMMWIVMAAHWWLHVEHHIKAPCRKYYGTKYPNRWKSWIYVSYYMICFAFIVWVYPILGQWWTELEGKIGRQGDGWWREKKVDVSDPQWSKLRRNFKRIGPALAGFVLVSNIVQLPSWRRSSASSSLGLAPHCTSSRVRMLLYFLFGLLMVHKVHGAGSLILFAIASINFAISAVFRASVLNPLLTWAFNLFILVTCDVYQGYDWAWLGPGFEVFNKRAGYYRWYVQFGLTMFRLISYNMDYYWALRREPVKQYLAKRSDYDRRVQTSLEDDEYNFVNYLAYLFYFPLYIAGPVCSFNAFVSQVYEPQRTHSLRWQLRQWARLAFLVLCIEYWLHMIPNVSLFHHYALERAAGRRGYYTKMIERTPSLLVALNGVWFMAFMYAKFLAIWRFFRLVAIADGVDCPDNMTKYQWTLRYLYVPLGGRKYQILSIFIIFPFVGIWHDISWTWFTWAMLNCACICIEIGAALPFTPGAVPRYLPKSFCWLDLSWMTTPENEWWFFFLRSFGNVTNIFLLMFTQSSVLLGLQGTTHFMSNIFLKDNLLTCTMYVHFLYGWVQAMAAWRSERAWFRAGKPDRPGPFDIPKPWPEPWAPRKIWAARILGTAAITGGVVLATLFLRWLSGPALTDVQRLVHVLWSDDAWDAHVIMRYTALASVVLALAAIASRARGADYSPGMHDKTD